MTATWVDPPAMVTQLRTQLVACAAWTPGQAGVNYPEVVAMATATYPLAVLAATAPRAEYYADGAPPLMNGTLLVVIHSTDTIGVTEILASTLLQQLLSQIVGIPFRSSECGISSDPSPAKVAGGSSYRAVTITLPYGLEK